MSKQANKAVSTKGVLLVLAAGVSWGVISLSIRALTRLGMSSLDITAVRSLATALILMIALGLASRSCFHVRIKDLWCLAGCGLASITLFNVCYFATMQRTTVGVAVILLYTSPIFVTLMSCLFFRERFTWRKGLALVMVMVGCVLVSGVLQEAGSAPLSLPVLCLGLGAGFSYALYSIFGRFAQERGYSSVTITLWSFMFAGAAALFMLDWETTWPLISNGRIIWPLLGLVVISTIIPYIAYTAGLKLLPPSTAAIVAAVEPVVATLVGILMFQETLSWSGGTGMVLIMAAMFL